VVSHSGEIGARQERARGLRDLSRLYRPRNLWRLRGDEGAPSALRLEVAECLQLVVGPLHRERGDSESFAEIAVRQQSLAGRQPAAGDGVHHLPHDLAVDRQVARGVDRQVHTSDIYLYITYVK